MYIFIVFKRLFNKGNRKHFPSVNGVYRNTCGNLGNSKLHGNTRTSCSCSHAISPDN